MATCMIDVGIESVNEVYDGPGGMLWQMLMGEEIHVGGQHLGSVQVRAPTVAAEVNGKYLPKTLIRLMPAQPPAHVDPLPCLPYSSCASRLMRRPWRPSDFIIMTAVTEEPHQLGWVAWLHR